MFFCEACGKAVALKASKCPHCGRIFDAVKCPKCSFSGRPELFTDGCPSCGYLKRDGRDSARVDAAFVEIEGGLVSPDAEGLALGATGQAPGGRRKRAAKLLPVWAYVLLTATLMVVLVVLMIIVYMRL